MSGGVRHAVKMMARLKANGNSRGAALVDNALQLQVAALTGDGHMRNTFCARLERLANRMQSVNEIHIYECTPASATADCTDHADESVFC